MSGSPSAKSAEGTVCSVQEQKPIREIGGKRVREEMARMGADEI